MTISIKMSEDFLIAIVQTKLPANKAHAHELLPFVY